MSGAGRNSTTHADAAVAHLNKLKPYDGWALDTYVNSTGRKLVMLLRRGVPLSDVGFEDVVHDVRGDGSVVGLSVGKSGQGVVLVEKDGTVCRSKRQVRISVPLVAATTSSTTSTSRGMASPSSSSSSSTPRRSVGGTVTSDATPTPTPSLSDEQFQQVMMFGVGIAALVIVTRMIAASLVIVYVVALPLTYFYLISTCPSDESFEAKKEMKRVLRGHHLPEDHPDKPKDWLRRTMARVSASVGTEIATGLGYQQSLLSLGGAVTLATVRVPSVGLDLIWIGAVNKWYFVMQREIPATTADQ